MRTDVVITSADAISSCARLSWATSATLSSVVPLVAIVSIAAVMASRRGHAYTPALISGKAILRAPSSPATSSERR